MIEKALIILFILLASSFFFYNARMILRIKSFQQFFNDYRAGKIDMYQKIFFLNIQLNPGLFQKTITLVGDKNITRIFRAFGYFLMLAGIFAVLSAGILLFVPIG